MYIREDYLSEFHEQLHPKKFVNLLMSIDWLEIFQSISKHKILKNRIIYLIVIEIVLKNKYTLTNTLKLKFITKTSLPNSNLSINLT